MKCKACKGSGWNNQLKNTKIIAPINENQNFDALKEYIKNILLCSKCKGSGKIK